MKYLRVSALILYQMVLVTILIANFMAFRITLETNLWVCL